jgi:hypothetical protein
MLRGRLNIVVGWATPVALTAREEGGGPARLPHIEGIGVLGIVACSAVGRCRRNSEELNGQKQP